MRTKFTVGDGTRASSGHMHRIAVTMHVMKTPLDWFSEPEEIVFERSGSRNRHDPWNANASNKESGLGGSMYITTYEQRDNGHGLILATSSVSVRAIKKKTMGILILPNESAPYISVTTPLIRHRYSKMDAVNVFCGNGYIIDRPQSQEFGIKIPVSRVGNRDHFDPDGSFSVKILGQGVNASLTPTIEVLGGSSEGKLLVVPSKAVRSLKLRKRKRI